MKNIIFLTFLLSLPCMAQPWTTILSSSRAIDWSAAGLPATLPDGETTANPWTPPVRSQCGSTLTPVGGGSDDVPQIASAISSCGSKHYVLLGSGTFQINSKLALDGNINLSRGSGPQHKTLYGQFRFDHARRCQQRGSFPSLPALTIQKREHGAALSLNAPHRPARSN